MQYTINARGGEKYDVIVCGGGTAGVMASVASARGGAKTLLIESSFIPGGMLTQGHAGITKFTEHFRDAAEYKRQVLDRLSSSPRSVQVAGGLPHEFARRMWSKGGALSTNGDAGSYVFTDAFCAQETLIDMLDEAGVTVLYGTHVCDVRTDGARVAAVLVHNKDGFTEYPARVFIDATGDGDVAAMAGAPFSKGVSPEDIREGCGTRVGEMTVFGVMYRVSHVDFSRLFAYLEENPGRFWQHEFGVMTLADCRESYDKGDVCVFRFVVDLPDGKTGLVQVYDLPERDQAILLGPWCDYAGDGTNAGDLSLAQHALVKGARQLTELLRAVPGFEEARILRVPEAGVRETRHIIGDYVLTALDVLTGCDFPDSVACGGHPVDVHPLPPEVENMPMEHWRFHIPYRILLPKGVDALLTAGRCVSSTRLAGGSIRTTVQCMALGEAAGTAAAMAAQSGTLPRDIDIELLREKLLQGGAIL